ncbi:MAG TPA: hypothetical protein VN310_08685 [Candidatus Dormibacteraeota bacterium]|jgi:hypothetical protein|nr:hypothetical protein [Candidatus Dormibacteraeota bacterium]
MKSSILVPIVLCAALPLAAQSAPSSIYAESFRHGSTQIVEESFSVSLSPQNQSYRERIKDSHGADRYIFSIIPQGPLGDTKITSWVVKLADLHHPIYDNVLLTSLDPSSDPRDALWRLEPTTFARVPVDARRVIKVDSFYVVLQVKAHHFTPPDSPYLDSMAVDVEFRDTDPRQPAATEK